MISSHNMSASVDSPPVPPRSVPAPAAPVVAAPRPLDEPLPTPTPAPVGPPGPSVLSAPRITLIERRATVWMFVLGCLCLVAGAAGFITAALIEAKEDVPLVVRRVFCHDAILVARPLGTCNASCRRTVTIRPVCGAEPASFRKSSRLQVTKIELVRTA